MSEDEWLDRQVWTLHCRGMTVSEIAERLLTDPDEVRAIVCEIWRRQGDEQGA